MTAPPPLFKPLASDPAGIVSWVHIGDLHMTATGGQNRSDLIFIVEEINRAFASSVAFVFLPGDIADDGGADSYTIVRGALDQLAVPWCTIVGDHDVHEKSFANFLRFMAHATHYSFQVGPVRFIALNAFDVPDPAAFCVLPNQLNWLQEEVRKSNTGGAVLFLHCYPSDLKQGGEQLRKLMESPQVRLIDMGHTHYNELANDGKNRIHGNSFHRPSGRRFGRVLDHQHRRAGYQLEIPATRRAAGGNDYAARRCALHHGCHAGRSHRHR